MNSIRFLAAVGSVAFSLVAFAQQAPLPAGTSAAVVPAGLHYRSAFEGYRAYQRNQRVLITGMRNRILARMVPYLPRRTILDIAHRIQSPL